MRKVSVLLVLVCAMSVCGSRNGDGAAAAGLSDSGGRLRAYDLATGRLEWTAGVGKLSPVTIGATDRRVLLSVGDCPEQPHKLEALATRSGRLEWQITLGANAI